MAKAVHASPALGHYIGEVFNAHSAWRLFENRVCGAMKEDTHTELYTSDFHGNFYAYTTKKFVQKSDRLAN